MTIVLQRRHSAIGRAISWFTRSPWNHAWILDEETGEGWEATWPRVKKHYDLDDVPPGCELLQVRHAGTQRFKMRDFLDDQVGKPYDLNSLLRFLTRKQEARKARGKWFCSELVFAAFQDAGIDLLHNIEPYQVSPAHLSWSTIPRPVAWARLSLDTI